MLLLHDKEYLNDKKSQNVQSIKFILCKYIVHLYLNILNEVYC